MKVIDRLTITPAMVTTTATNTQADWAVGTTYAKGDRRIYGQDLYESLQDANTGKQPDTQPTWWVRVGPSNKWAAFDDALNTRTTATAPLELTVTPGTITNAASFLNLDGTELRVEVYDGATQVYDKTYSLDGTPMFDWYMYFFEPYDFLSEVVVPDLPPYSTGKIVAKLIGSGSVSIGAVIVGSIYDIGTTEQGVNFGIRDYSSKEEDAYGNLTLVERDYAKRMEPTVFVENKRLNFVSRILSRLRAKPTVFIGSTDTKYQSLVVFGTLRDWNIEISYPEHSLLRLQVNGFI